MLRSGLMLFRAGQYHDKLDEVVILCVIATPSGLYFGPGAMDLRARLWLVPAKWGPGHFHIWKPDR